MRLQARLFRQFATVLTALACSACTERIVRATVPAKQERVAHDFIRVLVDSGVERALPRLSDEARRLTGMPMLMGQLRDRLSRTSLDSLALLKWKVEYRPDSSTATKIVYSVSGLGEPFLVGVWMEPVAAEFAVVAVFFGTPTDDGRPIPGDK